MSTQDAARKKSPEESLNSNARGQLSMLLLQFLVGIAVSLIGMPSETNGFPRIATSILLGLHILLAIGVLAGAIRAIPQCSRISPPATGLAWWGLAAVVISFVAGVLTFAVGFATGWFSFVMAAGGTGALVLYGVLYLRAIR